jgi:YD repeat-containing protein
MEHGWSKRKSSFSSIQRRRLARGDQNSRTTTYTYDDADRLVSVTDAEDHVTQYAYDTENNLLSITEGANRVTSFEYDAMGRVVQKTFPSTQIAQGSSRTAAARHIYTTI